MAAGGDRHRNSTIQLVNFLGVDDNARIDRSFYGGAVILFPAKKEKLEIKIKIKILITKRTYIQ